MAADHGVAVRLDAASAAGVVLADPERLTQVLTNLLSNAIKFSPRDAEVVVATEQCGQWVCINIRDQGPGIPEDYKDRIFDKFVQVDATDRRRRGGTGLGLSIAKEIVAQLDGDISFETAPGAGTTFRVEFPAYDPGTHLAPAADPILCTK